MKINKEKNLSIPVDGIAKVEMAKVDVIGTILLAGISGLVIFAIVGWIIISSSGGMGLNFTGNH